ncbi:MAG: STAS domain-containing protein [Oscillospiraceae bacterium]|nr:STAS domain-containing protein [Oscillospiraceae bacterium]
MELSTEKNGAELIVQLSGELNTLTAPELAALLDKELDGVETLTLDFKECDYVSSAGLRVLLGTFKQMKASGGDMCLVNVGENFMDVLQNTGLDAVFDVETC